MNFNTVFSVSTKKRNDGLDWIGLRKPQTSIPASDFLLPGLLIYGLVSLGLFQKLDAFQSTEYTYLKHLCLSILFGEK